MTPSILAVLSAMLLAAPSPADAATLQLPPQRTGYSGKMTWIGKVNGAYAACGVKYQPGSMYVAVSESVLKCNGQAGAPITITCNGRTVQAVANDLCPGCDTKQIDVSTAVYAACGFDIGDGGMQNSGISWTL